MSRAQRSTKSRSPPALKRRQSPAPAAPVFTGSSALTPDASDHSSTHVNRGDAPVTYSSRVRAVGPCTGARGLFPLPLPVQVLPPTAPDPQNANGSPPADNPQT